MFEDPDEQYWVTVAAEFKAKCDRADVYVRHSAERGRLKEDILREFLLENTPKSYGVESGFIWRKGDHILSRQCDILAYEHMRSSPLYHYGNLVIVSASAARAVVEVKSDLKERELKHIIKIRASISRFGEAWPLMLAVGIKGTRVDKLIQYYQQLLPEPRKYLKDDSVPASGADLYWLPDLIMILGSGCIAFRSSEPNFYFLADLGRGNAAQGAAIANLMRMYALGLGSQRQELVIRGWFDKLPAKRKYLMSKDGKVEDVSHAMA